jgi:hypothetical protein
MTTANSEHLFEALDWHQYACQCSQHSRTPCPNRATHVVEIHALHACNEPGLNPFGNRVEIRCFECVMRLTAEVGTQLATRFGVGECASCGAPVAVVGDVVRNFREL